MAKEIDWEIREKAEELYIVDGLTFEQTATQTKVSVNQLKNWSAAEGWREKREEYRKAKKVIRSTLMTLRQKLAQDAVANPDPQKIYAFIRLEELVEKKEKKKAIEKAADTMGNIAKKEGVSAETIQKIRRDVLMMTNE